MFAFLSATTTFRPEDRAARSSRKEKKRGESRRRRLMEQERLIKLPEVLDMVGMKKTAWYDGIKAGVHPPPIKRSPRDTVWPLSAIQKLVSDTIAAGGNRQAG